MRENRRTKMTYGTRTILVGCSFVVITISLIYQLTYYILSAQHANGACVNVRADDKNMEYVVPWAKLEGFSCNHRIELPSPDQQGRHGTLLITTTIMTDGKVQVTDFNYIINNGKSQNPEDARATIENIVVKNHVFLENWRKKQASAVWQAVWKYLREERNMIIPETPPGTEEVPFLYGAMAPPLFLLSSPIVSRPGAALYRGRPSSRALLHSGLSLRVEDESDPRLRARVEERPRSRRRAEGLKNNP